jgi:phage-related protein
MPAIGLGVREVRVHTDLEHRVIYLAKFDDAVHVLHAFQKRSQRTPKPDLEIARKRFRELLRHRWRRGR